MKLDEFKEIEEGFWRDLAGSGIGQSPTPSTRMPKGAITKQYIEDFIDNATDSIETAIRGGLVDPKSTEPAGPPKSAPAPTTENKKYSKLNNIFESIVEAITDDQMSIANFLRNLWYPKYMKGINYASQQKRIDSILNDIQATYAKDKGKAGLTTLANFSSSFGDAGGDPDPKPDPTKDDEKRRDYVLQAIEYFKKSNPEMHRQILDTLTKP